MGGHLRPAPGAGSGQRGAPRWRMHQRGWRRPAGAAAAAEWTLGRVCARAWPRLAAPVQRAAAVRLAIGRTEQRQVRGSAGRRCFKPGASVPQPGPQGSDPARISARRCPILVARGLPAAGGKGGARTRSSGARGRRRSSAEALAGSHRLPRNRSADLAACRRGSAPALPRKSALLSKIRPCASPRREARPSRRVPSGALSRVGSAGLQKKKVQAGRSDVGRQTRAVARRAGLGRGWERAETPEGAQGVQTAPPRNRSCAVRAMQARPPDHSRRRGRRGAPRTRPASPTGSCSMPCPVQCGAPQTAERAMPRHRAPARGKPCPGPQFGARAPRLGDESTTARLCFNCCVWENLALAPSQRTAAAQ